MQIHYISILLATVAQFILGAVWYSPLMFGKWWMKIMGADHCTPEEIKKMQKSMGFFYAAQFLLTILFTFTLSGAIYYAGLANAGLTAYCVAFWIWLGIMMPLVIGGVIWGNTKKEVWCKQIFVMAAYQLVGIMLAALIL
jgi:hypothetical protein